MTSMKIPNTISPEETITIPLKEFTRLTERDDWLACLEAAGVDNWQGYDYACELSQENRSDK